MGITGVEKSDCEIVELDSDLKEKIIRIKVKF